MQEKLVGCKLFRGLNEEVVGEIIEQYGALRSYARGDVVATQGSKCGSLMILAEGQLVAEASDRRGQKLHSEMINAPVVVAPASLFSDNPVLPATLTVRNPATLLTIPRENFTALLRENGQVLANFLEILSSGDKFVSERTIYLACKTIKGKIARYLLDRSAQEESLELRNPLTQREMAELFGVTRPALARALGELSEQGTIYVRGKQVTILFAEKLKQYIK